MTGLEIKICCWFLDPSLLAEVQKVLEEGKISARYCVCNEPNSLTDCIRTEPPDLVIANYDASETDVQGIEKEMESHYGQIPLIYLVSAGQIRKAADSIRSGVWDVVEKDQLFKLIPSVYSARKYHLVILQQKEAERSVKESRDRYMSIFENVNDAIFLFDFETRELREFNPMALKVFELTEEEMKTLELKELSVEEEGFTMDAARQLIAEAAQKKEPVSFEWKNRTRTGKEFWTLNSFSIVQIDDKPHILLVSRDIDDQKKMEQSLLDSQRHFRALAENSPDVIMRFDREHRHIYVNTAAEEQTGIPLEAFQGKSHREMGMFPEDKVQMWEAAIKKVFQSARPHTIVFDFEAETQTTTFEWRLYPELGTDEEVETIIGVARDITEARLSQDALAMSEERLNLALQATQLGMWDWNMVTNEVYYSPIWMSMLGYGPDELPQELDTWTSLLHPEDQGMAWDVVQSAIKNREDSFDVEFRLRQKTGGYLWVRSQGKAVEFDKEGNTSRLSGIHENVDERKRSEMVQQVLFDISNAVSSTQSLDELYVKIRESLGRVLDTTNCFLALYNEKSDTLTLPFMEDEKDSFTEFPARKTLTSYVIRTGEAQLVDQEKEEELIKKGEIEPVGAPCVSWLGVPLKHDGETIGVFAIQSYSEEVVYTSSDADLLEFASDQIALAIERRRQQDNLSASKDKQRKVFESSPDPMIVVDKNATILDFNSAFLEVFGVEKEIVYGEKIFRFINRIHWRQAISDFNETWEKGYLKNLEYQIVRPDGVTFDGEVSSGAIFSSKGKPDSMVLILKNITERKEAERKILEAKYRAEESDKLKTAFLSNMSHEIRTPMNAIVGFSDLLSDEGLSSEERRDFIAQINQGADDLMRLIDDIIDIAKIEAGQVNVHIAECFIRDLYRELQLMFIQNIKRAGKDSVSMEVQWDWPVSDLAIYTDPFRLKQILVNLLSNAVKFTEEGQITLGLEDDPRGIRFYVKDSGIGIREEKQKVIFDRFMQGHETKTKLYGGTGLGLAISKNLTEILGGEIGVESKSGEGATFWFILPRNEVPLKYEAALRAPVIDTRSWAGKKILIAEDDHSNYYFLYEALKETGVEVIWAKDGEETIAVFNEHTDLDAVLMDINMPLRNGYECTRIIKKERPDLPVIAQTAYAMSGEREISRDAGCDDYLSKPIKVKELIDTLAQYI
jgi:PAS domain S-box-containing protein